MEFTARKPGTLSHYEALVLQALRTLASALDEALDLQALATPACMAPLHFHRVFRGLVGETPLQMHRRLRLERAAWRLAEGDDTVLRIALDAGYETHEAFTRAFRDAFGRSPVQHRVLARDGTPPHHLQAACGLHVEGAAVAFPADPTRLFIHHGVPAMDVRIETLPPLRVAALPHTGPYPTIGAAFDRLGAIAGPAGLFGLPGARIIAIYHDDPETTPADQLRSAAGVSVAADAPIPPALTEIHLPAGRWACALHQGPYRGLGDAWQRLLGQWLPHSGHRLGPGECFEQYLNTPADTREEDLRTLLFVPIQG